MPRIQLTRRSPENRKFAQSSVVAPVGGGGGGVSLDWFSDWRAGTGSGGAAIHDGTGANAKWGSDSGGNVGTANLQVIAASGLGFPAGMTNVLQSVLPTTTVSSMVRTTKGKFPSPSTGQYIYYRWYMRCDFPNLTDGFDTGGLSNHPITSDNINEAGSGPGELKWEYHQMNVASNQLNWWFEIEPFNSSQKYRLSNVGGAVMMRTSTYMLEQRLLRTGAATAKVALRITDSSNALIATETNFINNNNGTTTLAADNPDIPLGSDPDAQFQTFSCGNNGPNLDAGRSAPASTYWGGWATRVSASASDWIGTYPVAGVES